MSCAANYAWVNRSSMTFLVRQAFAKQFSATPVALDMHVVYDVSHNIAKVRHITLAMHGKQGPLICSSAQKSVFPSADVCRPCMYPSWVCKSFSGAALPARLEDQIHRSLPAKPHGAAEPVHYTGQQCIALCRWRST